MKKRVISFIVFLFIIISNFSLYSYASPSLDTEIDEDVTDEIIFGSDDRTFVSDTTVFPYSACVYVEAIFKSSSGSTIIRRGSGNMIDSNMVLTCAHCLYDVNYGWAKTVTVYPGRNGASFPFGSIDGIAFYTYDGYNGNPSRETDIGLIRLNTPVGKDTGWFDYTKSFTTFTSFTTCGYPAEYNQTITYKLMKTTGTVGNKDDEIFTFKADTSDGQSGSGIYNSKNKIFALVSGYYTDLSDNIAVSLTSNKIDFINSTISSRLNVYRLYNQNSGEHFFTKDFDEYCALVNSGWSSEDTGWIAPSSGNPVYRLYNNTTGEHMFTANSSEKSALQNSGWTYEKIAFYSDTACSRAVYRLYNPNQESHNHFFTANAAEKNNLVNAGWNYEGIAFYACEY